MKQEITHYQESMKECKFLEINGGHTVEASLCSAFGRWSSNVIITGYIEAENALSLMAIMHSLKSTGAVKVL